MLRKINSNDNKNIDGLLSVASRAQRAKAYEQHYRRIIDLGFGFSFLLAYTIY
tara:strand:- start:1104 stop:1262 length:159 start_codon:yes stop_codon:yes gene_type:complete